MASSYVLLTGFEPYGGRSSNPAYEVMRVLDGKELAGPQSSVERCPSLMPRCPAESAISSMTLTPSWS
jgi:pyrrolidone-carboxylate peptidase